MVIDKDFKKFLAFEWIVFVILCVFWPTAIYLPLLFNGFFDHKSLLQFNTTVMFGPYIIYLIVRSVYLFYRSLRWAYLVSNFFFRSDKERKIADEWFVFILLGLLWGFVIVWPLYLVEMFKEKTVIALLIMAGPYVLSVFYRLILISVRRAMNTLAEK